jgi:hypothetical protein
LNKPLPHIPAIVAETRVMEHLRELSQKREAVIASTIPVFLPKRLRRYCEHYARVAVAHHGRRALRRVVYPWQPRPLDPRQHPEARVPRGRLSNPTALPQPIARPRVEPEARIYHGPLSNPTALQ